jgi:hypothetical protein
MPFTRSNVLAFTAGVAAGATAFVTYPRWKKKVAPLISAVISGATAAAQDAQATAGAANGEFHAGREAMHSPWISARDGANAPGA